MTTKARHTPRAIRIPSRMLPRGTHQGTVTGTYRRFGYACSCGWATDRAYASQYTAGNAWIRHADADA
jgi:hypothetical protein